MASKNIRSFRRILQHSIQLDDSAWSYRVPNLPSPSTLNSQRLVKSITVVSNSSKQQIILQFQVVDPNRAVNADPLDRFILISFTDFRLRVPRKMHDGKDGNNDPNDTEPAPARESADYIVRLLRTGVSMNGTHFYFYGHSNSQLKSRSCFLYAASKRDISIKIEALGDFSKMKTVAKKAKRIGLLFSTAQMATELKPERCEDIPDIQTKDYIFTDGCGLISPHLAHLLVKQVHIAFRNVRYTPSVFQIRYRGYKGVVAVDPALKGQILIKFRSSMKKFSGGEDLSFSVVDYSKPYSFGYLNDEVVLLLHALGVQEEVFLRKQAEHFGFLASTSSDPRAAFRFLSYVNHPDLAEKVLMDSLESVQLSVNKLVNSEFDKMLNKRREQRCRILVPKSRLLFGVCDAWDVLKEGECAVKVTMDGDGQPRTIKSVDVLVTRNPCLHPGDLQKFKAVERAELAHLVDCIVFSTRGKRPSADLMSGGDLDGDTFFVCWDSDLIPEKLSQAAEYPGAREPVKFDEIIDDDRLEYFARYTNASLGRVKNLFLDWARIKGPMSPECQQLNRLFSQCVDGNRIKVPPVLEKLPPAPAQVPKFILDTLWDAARELTKTAQLRTNSCDGFTFDAMQLLLSRDDIAMSEFELILLTYRWCRKNNFALIDFLDFFDFNILSNEEKTWALSHLPQSNEIPALVLNALWQSSLLQSFELQPFKLHYPGLRWKCVFDSSRDRLATFLDKLARTMELFHRKLIVMRVDERLTVAIYIPQKIERSQESQVDNHVRLFAFPHSQGHETAQRQALPTKVNYRLYCDGNVFQLFETARANSWVYLVRGPSNDGTYRNLEDKGDRRRGRQTTLESGLNFDCRASIALDKFSQGLKRHIGRVHRNGILGALAELGEQEIYVISNRDVRSMQNLDLWLEYVDTREVMPLFERNAREYAIPKLADVDWSILPDHLIRIARDKSFSPFQRIESVAEYTNTFFWLLERGERGTLLQVFDYFLVQFSTGAGGYRVSLPNILRVMMDFLTPAPFLSISFARFGDWSALPPRVYEILGELAPKALRGLVLSTNEMQELAIEPFRKILSQLRYMSPSAFVELVELIALTVRSPDIALDILLECLEPESIRILTGRPIVIRHLVRNCLGIALDHIDEAAQSHPARKELLEMKSTTGDFLTLECRLRIDAPTSFLAVGDHVRLTAASSPQNSIVGQRYSMDALVEFSEPGFARFRCFHPRPHFAEQCSWELRNCGSFVTSKTMLDALLTLVTEQGDCCGVYEDILGFSSEFPRCARQTPPKYTAQKNLNPSQNAAVEAALANNLLCLWGPPGTGKTHTIVEIIRQLQETEGERILVTAPTHNAVDNVMRKYFARLKSDGPPNSAKLFALRVSTDVRKVAEDLKKYTCDAMVGKEIHTSHDAHRKAQQRIKDCRLIFTTCIGAGLGLLRSEKFHTVIVDEASQQTEPASLVPLVKGCAKAILVGDHVQLRATVQQHAVLQGYDVSLFERLYTETPPRGNTDKPHSSPSSRRLRKVMLDTQYRMHESICRFPSSEFYSSKLLTGVLPETRTLPTSAFNWPRSTTAPGDSARMLFVQCSEPEDFGRKSKSNQGQADLCRLICRQLTTSPSPIPDAPSQKRPSPTSIAVLTPYSRQADLLKRVLGGLSNANATVEVSSIDGFQGREADVVVLVTVRCNVNREIGFLKDLRRMNVALTRAKSGLIVVGDRGTLTGGSPDEESYQVWGRLLSSCVGAEVVVERSG